MQDRKLERIEKSGSACMEVLVLDRGRQRKLQTHELVRSVERTAKNKRGETKRRWHAHEPDRSNDEAGGGERRGAQGTHMMDGWRTSPSQPSTCTKQKNRDEIEELRTAL